MGFLFPRFLSLSRRKRKRTPHTAHRLFRFFFLKFSFPLTEKTFSGCCCWALAMAVALYREVILETTAAIFFLFLCLKMAAARRLLRYLVLLPSFSPCRVTERLR